jgi:hypothetical protein
MPSAILRRLAPRGRFEPGQQRCRRKCRARYFAAVTPARQDVGGRYRVEIGTFGNVAAAPMASRATNCVTCSIRGGRGTGPSETFRLLKKNDIARFGEYRTARLVLAAYDQLAKHSLDTE